MVRKAVVLGLIAVLALSLAGMAAAGPGKGGFRDGMRGDPTAWAKRIQDLQLTDEQLSQIRTIQTSEFEKTQGLRTSLAQKMHELRMLYWQKNPDQNAITAKRNEISEIQKQLAAIAQETRDKMNKVLTQEQLAKIGQQYGFGLGPRGKFGMRMR